MPGISTNSHSLYQRQLRDRRPAASRPMPPRMTVCRALIIRLIEIYRRSYSHPGFLDLQKMAYFLQSAGAGLRLRFSLQKMDVYADNLHYVLKAMDGYFIGGYWGGKLCSPLRLMPQGIALAHRTSLLEGEEQLASVQRLVSGWESSHRLKLLGLVHWFGSQGTASPAEIYQQILRHSPSRKTFWRGQDVDVAFVHLDRLGWFPDNECGTSDSTADPVVLSCAPGGG